MEQEQNYKQLLEQSMQQTIKFQKMFVEMSMLNDRKSAMVDELLAINEKLKKIIEMKDQQLIRYQRGC